MRLPIDVRDFADHFRDAITVRTDLSADASPRSLISVEVAAGRVYRFQVSDSPSGQRDLLGNLQRCPAAAPDSDWDALVRLAVAIERSHPFNEWSVAPEPALTSPGNALLTTWAVPVWPILEEGAIDAFEVLASSRAADGPAKSPKRVWVRFFRSEAMALSVAWPALMSAVAARLGTGDYVGHADRRLAAWAAALRIEEARVCDLVARLAPLVVLGGPCRYTLGTK